MTEKVHFRKDLTGKVFGRLTVTGYSHQAGKSSVWNCLCVCGNTTQVRQSNLTRGGVVSCGCRRKEIQNHIKFYSPESALTHGCARTRLGKRTAVYTIWCGMKRRCSSPKCKCFSYYGGRGIKVCKRWEKFENFLADMGKPKPGMTLDRFPDKDGDYEPTNCRWATWKEQANNQRPRSFFIDKPEHADILQKILSLHSLGKTTRDIADVLNSMKIMSPRGKCWWGSGIDRILRNHR